MALYPCPDLDARQGSWFVDWSGAMTDLHGPCSVHQKRTDYSDRLCVTLAVVDL